MVERVAKLRHFLKENGLDGFIVSNQQNWHYLSGFTGDNGALLITDKECLLLTDFRYVDQAEDETQGFEIVQSQRLVNDSIVEYVHKLGIKKVGFEETTISYIQYKYLLDKLSDCELIPVKGAVEKIRQVKDSQELQYIRKAAEIADQAFEIVLKQLKPGLRENEISAELEYQMKKMGSEKPAFDTIIASGVRAALPHGAASDKVIENGDFLTMDFGAVYKGYHSDMTRTVVIGQPNEKQAYIYDLVLKAQVAATEAIKPGLECLYIDGIARDIISKEGYGDKFGHGLGHSVGLEIHENPSFNTKDTTRLQPGMVITVEPGIYITGWGGVRIEDLVLVTEHGYEILSTSTKKLLVI